MPKLVVILGPLAVGKMTVGQELAKITGLKLFHNHMTIDLVSNFFSYSSQEGKYLVNLFRQEIFETVAKSTLEGIIFTFVCGFDDDTDWNYLQNIKKLFAANDSNTYFVELEADYDERFRRNKTENRLANKPTKRNLEWSENNFIKAEQNHRLNSLPGEIDESNYIRIDNTQLLPELVAKQIKEHFNL